MKLLTFFSFALIAPSVAIRKTRRDAVANANCASLADLVVGGQDFGRTLELMCEHWPAEMGEFPIDDITSARDVFERLMGPGNIWRQIEQIREERTNRGFCWKNNTLRDDESGLCPLGYQRSGLRGLFGRTCTTGCTWSSHPVGCGWGCAENRGRCAATALDQAFVVAQGVSAVNSFVTGDDRIQRAVTAVINLAEFLLGAVPPLVENVQRGVNIVRNNEHGVVVAALLIQYMVSTAPEVGESVQSIREAIQHFADIIAEVAEEQKNTGSINTRSVIRGILDHGAVALDYAVRATQVFTHPTCSITANVAFTIETAGDDRLLGPWVQRGTVNGRPRYSMVGDRSTNLEWSRHDGEERWVMFSDGRLGSIGRRYLYAGPTENMPFAGWVALAGDEPLPEFLAVSA